MYTTLTKAITTILIPIFLSYSSSSTTTAAPVTAEVEVAVTNTNDSLLLNPREILADTHAALTLGAWTKPNCKGTVMLIKDVTYGVQNVPSDGLRSYSLSRDLTEGEQLDFSIYVPGRLRRREDGEDDDDDDYDDDETEEEEEEEEEGEEGTAASSLEKRKKHRGAFPPPKPCGLFVEKAEPLTKAGCWTLAKSVDCYRIWHH